jgi:hypothetical protein
MDDAAMSCFNYLIAMDSLALFLLLPSCKYIRPLTVVDRLILDVLDH